MVVRDEATEPVVRGTRRRAETRKRLVAVAYEVFAERGIRDTPVEAICERAGFTRGAFYSNFATKEDLFLALWQEQMQARLDRLQGIVDEVLARKESGGDQSVTESLAEIARTFMEPLSADTGWYLLVTEFRAHVLRLPELRPRVLAAEEQVNEGLARALAALLDGLGAALSVPVDDVVLVLVAVYETAIERAVLAGGALAETDRYLTELLPGLLGALVTPADGTTDGAAG